MEKSWIQESNRVSATYLQGVASFLEFACKSSRDGILPCPCKKCVNLVQVTQKVLVEHLLDHGFSPSYTYWDHHGEDGVFSTQVTRTVNCKNRL